MGDVIVHSFDMFQPLNHPWGETAVMAIPGSRFIHHRSLVGHLSSSSPLDLVRLTDLNRHSVEVLTFLIQLLNSYSNKQYSKSAKQSCLVCRYFTLLSSSINSLISMHIYNLQRLPFPSTHHQNVQQSCSCLAGVCITHTGSYAVEWPFAFGPPESTWNHEARWVISPCAAVHYLSPSTPVHISASWNLTCQSCAVVWANCQTVLMKTDYNLHAPLATEAGGTYPCHVSTRFMPK